MRWWLEQLVGRRGDIYSIPTTYSAQCEEDTGDVSKEGSIVSDQPAGRYAVPTLPLKSANASLLNCCISVLQC